MNDVDLSRCGVAYDKIHAACSRLEPGALEVLALIAERLVRGREKYGDLDVEQDGRDWWREFGEEMADGAVYAACRLLAKAKVHSPDGPGDAA